MSDWKEKEKKTFFPSTWALISRCLNGPSSEPVNLYTVNIELGDTSKLTRALCDIADIFFNLLPVIHQQLKCLNVCLNVLTQIQTSLPDLL